MHHYREGDGDEDAVLAAVVERGLARLMEEERRGAEGGGGAGLAEDDRV